MWLHCAPADDIMVVSEIGEQWSPQTEPARQADIPIVPRGLLTGNIANTIGIIDSDYYSNPDNDGNIGIFLKNISDKELKIFKGDKIAQGIFMKYFKVDNDKTTAKRAGGFGSTNK